MYHFHSGLFDYTDRDGDFADVKEAVMHLAADWQKLAIHLLLRRNDIEVIRRNNLGDSQACLNDTMALWLEDNYNTARFGRPSWRALVKVVMKMDKALAQEIANQHRGISGINIHVYSRVLTWLYTCAHAYPGFHLSRG